MYELNFLSQLCSYNGGRTAEDIIKFINGKANTKAGQKKAPSPVVDLDESNFDKVALDSSKDVLVEFYAPCKSQSCAKMSRFTCQIRGRGGWVASSPQALFLIVFSEGLVRDHT